MKNIFLHIGQPKTGTTAIQLALGTFQEQGLLKQHDFCYFGIISYLNFMTTVSFRNNKLFHDICMKKLSALLKEVSTSNIILSAEALASPLILEDEQFFKSFVDVLSQYKIKIFIYLRRYDLFCESMWNQQVKIFNTRCSSPPYRPYVHRKIINLYEKYFGKDNIYVRVYDKNTLYQNNSVCDFLEWIKLKDIIPHIDKTQRDNISLSPENLRISLSYIKQNLLYGEAKEKNLQLIKAEFEKGTYDLTRAQEVNIRRAENGINIDLDFTNTLFELYKLEKNTDSRSYAYLPLEERKKFLEACREDNAYIAREYLGKEDGILFDETLPQETVSLESPSTDDLVKSFLPMFVHLKQSVDSLTRDNAAMKEQLKKLEEENKKLAERIA